MRVLIDAAIASAAETADETPERSSVGDQPLQCLFEARGRGDPSASRRLSAVLRHRYGSDLAIALHPDRPTLIANFVATLDGAVALAPGTRSGGGDVSGHDPNDRFVMGLLRALSDVVLVGAGTVRAARGSGWMATGPDTAATTALAELRRDLGLARQPATLIATRGGDLDPSLPVFCRSDLTTVIAAPERAIARLRRAGFASHVRIASLGDDPGRSVAALIDVAAGLGAGLVLSEAGPHLLAELLADGWLDELFLTLAPRLVGRDESTPRLALLEGIALEPTACAKALRSVHRAGDALFLRYQMKEDDDA